MREINVCLQLTIDSRPMLIVTGKKGEKVLPAQRETRERESERVSKKRSNKKRNFFLFTLKAHFGAAIECPVGCATIKKVQK